MSSWWKWTALLAATGTLVAAVVGASIAGANTNARSGPNARAADTLRVMGFGASDDVGKSRRDVALKAIGNPGFQSPSGGFNDQQFLAAVASGDVPDLVWLTRERIGTYAAKGAFQPLTSCIKSQKINMKQYRAPAVREVTYKGRVYGIPEFYDVRTIIVNLDVIKAANVKLADLNTKNWTKLKAATRKLAKQEGGKVTRIGFDPKLPEFFPLWAKANGVDILSKDGLKPNLNNAKAIAALEYAVSLINIQGGWGKFKSFRDTFDFFGAGNQYAKDQLGAFPMEQWYYNVLAGASPQVHIHALPFRNKLGNAINYETGSAWAIPKGAKNATLACKFAKQMTLTSTWLVAARNRAALRKASKEPYTGLSTGNAAADTAIFKQTYTKINPYFDQAVKTVLDVQRYSFNIPASPAGAEFRTAWTNAVNRVLAGEQSARAALNQAQREAVAAINRNK